MKKKQSYNTINLRYKLLAGILVVLAAGLVLLPKYEKQEGIQSEALLNHIVSSKRYISTDELAHKIISQDPSFILIDVRDEHEYNNYSLPNAINIPLKKLLETNALAYLDQDQFDVILCSNDHFYADQAWVICKRLNFKNLYVLQGGLNKWFTTIINPKKPDEGMPATAFQLYSTRKASSMYFGVAYPDQVSENNTLQEKPKKIITVQKKKKRVAEGGC